MAERFQFSIRALLALTFAIAASIGILVAERTHIAGTCVLGVAIAWPAILTSMAVRHRGSTRAFCIGAAFPAFVGLALLVLGINGLSQRMVSATFGDNVDHFVLRAAAAEENYRLRILWLLMPAVGFMCVAANWALGVNKRRDAG